MIALTNSSLNLLRRCPYAYYLSMVLRLRKHEERPVLRRGTALHRGLEMWHGGQGVSIDCPQLSVMDAIERDYSDDEYELETVRALLLGYFIYYAADDLEFLAVEEQFDLPLVNPDTGWPSRTFRLAGKRDGRAYNYLIEHKHTTTLDDDYWLRLRNDTQPSMYVLSTYKHINTVIYNVIRWPGLRPKQIPNLDVDGYRIVFDDETGGRAFKKNGKPRQVAQKGISTLLTHTETPTEFGERVAADIAMDPASYYQRREVVRLDDDLEKFRHQLWQEAEILKVRMRTGNWTRCVDSKRESHCKYCEFADPCLQGITIDAETVPTGYYVRDRLHEELDEEATEERETNGT